MSLALLFPGQGVQHKDMLQWIHSEPDAAPALRALAERLGPNWRQRCGDDAWASSNHVAQTLVTGLGLAAWAALKPRLPPPTAVAGYSVGELVAWHAAGVFDAQSGLDLADQRATAMDRSAEQLPQGLVSVTGAASVQIDQLCAQFDLAVAIRISRQTCVLGGHTAQLAAAVAALKQTSATTTRLRVRIASHTPLMSMATQALASVVAQQPWQRSACVVINNVDGQGKREPGPLKAAFAKQVSTTVRWDLCMETLLQRRPTCLLEIGPGSSLTALWNSFSPATPCRSIDDFRSLNAVVNWVDGQVAGAQTP